MVLKVSPVEHVFVVPVLDVYYFEGTMLTC